MKFVSSNSNESFFEFYCVLPSRLSDFWSGFCFEKSAIGIQITQESVEKSTFPIFFNKRPDGGAKN